MKLIVYSHPPHLDWVVFDAQGKPHQRGSDHPPTHLPCYLVLPADKVLFARVKLPATARRQRDMLLAYAVEDQLLSEPEQQHVVWCGVDDEGDDALAIVERQWLAALLQELAEQGVQPECVVPETLLLPWEPECWTLAWTQAGGVLRTGRLSGMAVEALANDPPISLMLALRDATRKPQKILLHATNLELPDIDRWQTLLGQTLFGIEVAVLEPLGREQLRASCPVNLLQGMFARQKMDWSWLPQLRPAGVALLLLLLLQVVGVGVDWLRLSQEQKHLQAQMKQLFRTSFPDARVIVDAPLQMQRKLVDVRRATGQPAAGDFLPLLARIAPTIASQPKASLQALRYTSNQLDVTLLLPDQRSADSILAQLAIPGVTATLNRVEHTADGVLAHIDVRNAS